MRDLIATQNLDSFTARLVARCSCNWFLQIVVQPKIVQDVVWASLHFDNVIYQIWVVHRFSTKATSILQDQQNTTACIDVRKWVEAQS